MGDEDTELSSICCLKESDAVPFEAATAPYLPSAVFTHQQNSLERRRARLIFGGQNDDTGSRSF